MNKSAYVKKKNRLFKRVLRRAWVRKWKPRMCGVCPIALFFRLFIGKTKYTQPRYDECYRRGVEQLNKL